MNKFDTNAFAEGVVQSFEQLNRAFTKVAYMANLSCINWKKFSGYGKNNKHRWEGKVLYRSRAYIKALRNRKRGCMKYAKKRQRS